MTPNTENVAACGFCGQPEKEKTFPKGIGEALDAVCDILDEHGDEIQGWKNKWKWAVEMAARAEVERDELREILYQVSTGGYTPMAAHKWLQSHRANA